MAKVHNLDIYPHTGDRACLGCVDSDAPDDGEAGAASGADAGPAPAAAGSAAATPAGTPAGGSGGSAAPPPAAPPASQPHLIEVQILAAGGAPLGGVACEVVLPDGSTRTGTTLADGWLRMSVQPQTGAFQLRLPDVTLPEPG